MMKKKIFIFNLLLYLCLNPSSAQASEWLDCPALIEDNAYEGRESLKYLVPGQENWLFISNKDFMSDFSLQEKTLKAFKNFHTALQKKGTDLILVIVPQRGLIHTDKIDFSPSLAKNYTPEKARENYTKMIMQLETAGINVTPAPDFKTVKTYGYARDHHWNATGAKLMADLTAQKIKTLPAYTKIGKQQFRIEEGKEINFKGSFYNPVKDICQKELPIEKIKEQISVNINGDLFSDTKKEIVLVGTSFSEQGKSFANFAGHLRVSLSADIDNRSIGGGGISTSLLAYLESQEFKKNPAKILIWEIPGFYNLNRQSLLHKAIRILEHDS